MRKQHRKTHNSEFGDYPRRRMPLLASMRAAKMRDALAGWRNLTGGTPLHLGPHDLMIMRSYWMYFTNDIIGGMIDKLVAILVGNGFGFTSDDERVQDAINGFWDDPVNDLAWHEDHYAVEASVYGEMIFTLYTDPSGNVRLGTVDPYDVEYTIPDQRNRHLVAGLKLKDADAGAPQVITTMIAPGVPDETIFCKETVALRKTFSTADGPTLCLYAPFNRRFIQDGSPFGVYIRGTPDFLAAFDAAEDTDDILFAMRRRADVASRIVWDVGIEDAGKEEIDSFLADTPLPDEYAINAHNSKVKWNIIAPQLQASEHETEYRMFRNHTISSRNGMPPTWFGDGENSNKASSQEMPFAMLKSVLKRQKKLGMVYKRLISYHLYQKGLPYGMNDFDVVLPTISDKDLERQTNALARLTATLAQAEASKYLTNDEARQIWRESVQDLGYEMGDYEAAPESFVTPDYQRQLNATRRLT